MLTDNLNIEEELTCVYVQAYRSQYNEREVSKEKLVTAIKYLNTLSGGIAAHRKSERLIHALEHIDNMPDSRLDAFGLPQDYTKEDLHYLLVEEDGCLSEDFDRVIEKFLETRGFLPSPEEFIEFHDGMKGIVYLEQKVADTEKKVEETQQKMKQKMKESQQERQEMEETTQLLRQALQQERQQSEQLQQRLREQELTPEGEFQRRIREMEEENRRLRFHKLCKICLEEEIQMVFIPCGHTVSCLECAQQLTDEKDPSQRKCPVCRKNIEVKVRMFLA